MGGGDGRNGTVAIAENDQIKELASNNETDLARIYRYITLILGMRIGEHEYKVMGLAPYTSEYEIRKCDKVFKGVFHVPDLLVEYKNRPPDLFFHFRDNLADCRFDGVAGAVQEMVEEVGSMWVKAVTEKMGVGKVAVSGGLSMNVKLNKVIGELESVQDFYCPASGGDESLAVGACYAAQQAEDSSVPVSTVETNYLGSDVRDDEIEKVLCECSQYAVVRDVSNDDIAQLLADGLIIGRLAGRMEFGARPLGNRSILADPTNPSIVKTINRKIKFRDFWMPFAPSILESYSEQYLVNPKSFRSDHMTFTFDTKEEGKKALAAALHPADGTVRAHIVRRNLNPDYYDLINAFAKIKGVGALLNTSFNLHGYPIVRGPKEALHVFNNSELDAIIMNRIMICRK